MTKEELKQEAEEKSIAEYGCKFDGFIRGYLASAEPREKRIAELKSLKDVADLIRLNNSHIVAMAQLNNNNVALRKENAELKQKLNFSTQYYKGEKAQDQLTKAKELLTPMLVLMRTFGYSKSTEKLIEDVEQFLNSEVEK